MNYLFSRNKTEIWNPSDDWWLPWEHSDGPDLYGRGDYLRKFRGDHHRRQTEGIHLPRCLVCLHSLFQPQSSRLCSLSVSVKDNIRVRFKETSNIFTFKYCQLFRWKISEKSPDSQWVSVDFLHLAVVHHHWEHPLNLFSLALGKVPVKQMSI